MKLETSDSIKWTKISDETWFAHCVAADKDPEARKIV